MPVSADIVLVIATVVAVLSLSSIISAWTVRRWPVVAMISAAIAVGLFVSVHLNMDGGLKPTDIPDAFIAVAARILN